MQTIDKGTITLKDLNKGMNFSQYDDDDMRMGRLNGYRFYQITFSKIFTDETYYENYKKVLDKDHKSYYYGKLADGTFKIAIYRSRFVRF